VVTDTTSIDKHDARANPVNTANFKPDSAALMRFQHQTV